MKIEATQNGTQVILKVAGRMDAANATLFQEECESWVKGGTTALILDFTELAYISSMGLRSLVVIGKSLNGKLHICGLTGLVKQVFEITRLNSVFPIHDSVESALAAG